MSSPSPQPSKQHPTRKRFSVIGFTTIIVVIPFCLYYLYFVTSQTQYFSKRNLRVVAQIGGYISSKIDNLATKTVNKGMKAKQDTSSTTKVEGKDKSDRPKIEARNSGKAAINANQVRTAANPVADPKTAGDQREPGKQTPSNQATSVTRPPTAQASAAYTANSNRSPGSTVRNKGARASVAPQGNGPTATIEQQEAPAEARVALGVKPGQESFLLYLEYPGDAGASPETVTYDLDKLFDPFVSRYVIDELNETQERLFDAVMVAEQETGKVIFERGPSGLNVVSLENFLNTRGGKLELKLGDQSSTLTDVELAGTDYKLFLQPIRLTHSTSVADNQQGTRWVVCGLTRTDHFRDETFAISYTVLILFVFVVLLTAVSWPLLKLKLMGPKERMRRADLRLTMLSALLGTALVTFILLDLHTYFSLENTLDHNLERLSQKIEQNFRNEVGKALAQLRQLNERITTLSREERSGPLVDLRASFTSPQLAPTARSSPPFLSKCNILTQGIKWEDTEKDPYPYFNSATWTDPSGQQRIKWTTWPDTTTFIEVATREFFTNAKTGRLWRFDQTSSDSDYCVESLRSRLTGENVAVIATRVPGSSWVSNLDTRLLSLMGTVLPASYGYAVIDNNGKVIFHSDEVKNLEEQFFAECENRELRAAVVARTDLLINAKYLGKGHRLYVRPLSGTPWTLAVFRDKQAARTMNLEMLTISLGLYLGLALIIIALIAVTSTIYSWWQGQPITWLWPHDKRKGRYELLIVVYVLIGFVFAAALRIGNERFLLTCCVAIPLLATVLGMAIMGRDNWTLGIVTARRIVKAGLEGFALIRKPLGRRSPSQASAEAVHYRTGYAIALVGLLTLVSVLPAWGFFQLARNFELRLMLKQGQVSIAKKIEQRTQQVAAQYASIKIGDPGVRGLDDGQRQAALLASNEGKAAFLKQRLDLSPSNLDVYDSFSFDTRAAGLSHDSLVDENPSRIDAMLARLRPLYNQSCIESQELSRGASSDRLWRWKQDDGGRIYLEKDKDARAGDPSVVLMSSIPALVAVDSLWEWLGMLVVLPALGFSIYWLVRFVARRFFLLDFDEPSSPTSAGSIILRRSAISALGNRWYEKSFESYATSHHLGGYTRADLSQVVDWQDWRRKLTEPPVESLAIMRSDAPVESVAHLKAGMSSVALLKHEADGKSLALMKPEAPVESMSLIKSESALALVLDNFDYCKDNPAANREKLLVVEHFLQAGRRVVVVSTSDPLYVAFVPNSVGANIDPHSLSSPAKSGESAGANNGASSQPQPDVGKTGAVQGGQSLACYAVEIDAQPRWAAAFTSFAMVFADDYSDPQFVNAYPHFLRNLKTTKPWRYIEAIGKGILEKGALDGENCPDRGEAEEQISQVVEQARPYHQALWETCTEGQRCTLSQLAQDGMISLKNKHLRRLLKRQLVVRDPSLRLMDESFRRFVLSASSEQENEAWRQQEGGSTWQLMRLPLLLILVSVALFLFVTQKDVYDSTVTFLSALTAGIGALFKLLGMFNKDKAGS